MEKDENQTGYTLENGNMGQVQIADESVAIIAGLAATEVERALPAWQGNITNELVSKTGQEKPVKRDPCKGRRRYCKCKMWHSTLHMDTAYRRPAKGSGKGKSSDREYDRSWKQRKLISRLQM